MLIKGNLSSPLLFPTSSGVRGKTLTFQREESDNWVVVDTIGFGEGKHGSVLDAEARNKLYDFFVKIDQESYNYYAYVHKWRKLDELDGRLWKFFKQAFDGAERNFMIIFTHCKPQTLEENLEDIKVAFQECERYITVDFPASDTPETSSSVKARRNEKVREISLKRLEETLQRFMLPSKALCLRSNLKNGRILLMGTATKARNIVAKLLVDGTVNMTSMTGVDGIEISGNGEGRSTVFEELEGRRWQVVNALAFDSASIGDIYNSSLPEGKAVTAVSKLLASNFLTILEHGLYSHLVYVAESGKMPPGCKEFFQEILKARKYKSFRTIAVVVNYEGKVEQKVAKQLKELKTICEIQLPNFCDSTAERGREIYGQHVLASLEETLFQSPFWRQFSACTVDYPYGWTLHQNHGELDGVSLNIDSIVDPTAFKGLVYAYLEELQGMNKSINSSKNLWQKFASDLCMNEVEVLECGSNYRSVLRLPSNKQHIGAEFQCKWDEGDPIPKYLCITVRGDKKSLQNGLEKDYIWGELQVVDKHHVDRRIQRLPLTIGNCAIESGNMDTWFVGAHSIIEREFLESLSNGDALILWMNPYPNPLVPHEDKFEIKLQFCTSTKTKHVYMPRIVSMSRPVPFKLK